MERADGGSSGGGVVAAEASTIDDANAMQSAAVDEHNEVDDGMSEEEKAIAKHLQKRQSVEILDLFFLLTLKDNGQSNFNLRSHITQYSNTTLGVYHFQSCKLVYAKDDDLNALQTLFKRNA